MSVHSITRKLHKMQEQLVRHAESETKRIEHYEEHLQECKHEKDLAERIAKKLENILS